MPYHCIPAYDDDCSWSRRSLRQFRHRRNCGFTAAETTVNPEDEMTTIEKRQLVSDGFPDNLDFGGAEFMMLVATEHLYDA